MGGIRIISTVQLMRGEGGGWGHKVLTQWIQCKDIIWSPVGGGHSSVGIVWHEVNTPACTCAPKQQQQQQQLCPFKPPPSTPPHSTGALAT